jgi:hypothetical protein
MKNTRLTRYFLVAAAVATLGFAANANAQNTQYYNATTLPANPQQGVVHYMQLINLASGPGNYTLSTFQLGINFNDGTLSDYGVIVQFYNNVNTSSSATDALAGATLIATVNGTLADPGQPGNFTYTFNLTTPLALNVTGPIGVRFSLLNETLDAYSTDMNGRFSATAPTTGSASNFVWRDTNLDGTFSGSEQTTFGQSGAYVRFSMTGMAPVPEPSTWALMVGGAVLLGVTMRRRLRA